MANAVNRLATEKSPYLLQHAANPVAWYPWGEQAFARARAEDKPVFLSIGYSTCHWCHVMARESFADQETADLLNRHFIAVKVDREERPDIDAIYMHACQVLSGQGGWPLSVFLTPEKQVFFAGTYFPPTSKYGRPGFQELLRLLADQYSQQRSRLEDIARRVTASFGAEPKSGGKLTAADVDSCFRQLQQAFDPEYGGFGGAPKFPTPHNIMFLLRYHRWAQQPAALAMATATLDAMANGGIYDHLGYGFCRYATDRQWLIPHFEKMLYDNALLAIAYLEGWQVTGNQRYLTLAREILDYCQRALGGPEGSYLSAEDADSEGEEGKFYAWDRAEVLAALGPETGQLFCAAYNISEQGNFEGKNIPNLIGSDLQQVANYHNTDPGLFKQRLESARSQLFARREKRVHPHRDDKVLTAWNALLVAALAIAARSLAAADYLERAEAAYTFIENNLYRSGRLLARWRQGEAKHLAYIDDYAFLLWAANELHAASENLSWLEKGKKIARQMRELFWDEDAGGFFFTGHDGEKLIHRPKESSDGALPSGNSVAARELIRLARLTGEPEYEKLADAILAAFAGPIKEYPAGHAFMLQALQLASAPSQEAVLVGGLDQAATKEFLKAVRRKFLPELSLLVADGPEAFAKTAPFAAAIEPAKGATVYICRDRACGPPEKDLTRALARLTEKP